MNKKTFHPSAPPPSLRAKAEAQLARTPPDKVPGQSAEALLHELQVHQIELEMQNEALRLAQGDLEASRALYLDLYELAPVGYLSLSDAGLISRVNLTGAALLGFEREQLLNRRFESFVVAADRERWRRQFVLAKQQGGSHGLDLTLAHKDGSSLEAHLDCMKLGKLDDARYTLRIALADITEHRQAEHAQERLTKQLELLSERLMIAQEEERRRFAYELHEELGQELLSLKLWLQMPPFGASSTGGPATRKLSR